MRSSSYSALVIKNAPVPGRSFEASLGAAAGSSGDSGGSYKPPPPIKQGDEKLLAIVDKVMKGKKDVVIETRGPTGSDKEASSRAQAVSATVSIVIAVTAVQ